MVGGTSLLPQLRREVAPSPEVHLLDLGGGDGRRTSFFASGCGEVVVLDPDPRRVARGRKRSPQFRFEEGTAERVPFPDRRFDRVTMHLSFHHFSDAALALSEAGRVLKPQGRVLVADLEPQSWKARWFRAVHRFAAHGSVTFRTAAEVRAMLESAGFSEVKETKVGGAYLVAAVRGRA